MERLLEALADEPDPHTAVTRADAVDVHVADSLSGLAFGELRDARAIADVGAGAGFPGLPLAVALPHARVDLIESSRRKAAVLERLAAAAGASNARVVPARVETWGAGDGRETYDAVCIRAVGPLAVLVEYAAPLLVVGGALIAWKGARDGEEETAALVAASRVGLRAIEVLPVQPYPASRRRHLHLYSKVSPTPDTFPRRPGVAAKRPLA
jgi:16S rRNA (guanine527-N7)-methyltransferase